MAAVGRPFCDFRTCLISTAINTARNRYSHFGTAEVERDTHRIAARLPRKRVEIDDDDGGDGCGADRGRGNDNITRAHAACAPNVKGLRCVFFGVARPQLPLDLFVIPQNRNRTNCSLPITSRRFASLINVS